LDRDELIEFLRKVIEDDSNLPFGDQCTRLLSGLTFGQFMPNANHRTAIALLTLWLGINGIDLSIDGAFGTKASVFVRKSKEDIERAYARAAQFTGMKRQAYLWNSYWPAHLRLTKRFIEKLDPVAAAIQSGSWGRTPSSHLESLLTISSGVG